MKNHFILVLILLPYILAQCPSFHRDDLLESGKTTIMRSKYGSSPEYQYQYQLSLANPALNLEIAVTTSSIADYNPLPSSGFNYHLAAEMEPSYSKIRYKLIINNDLSWSLIQVSFLVSGRADMAIGNFQIPYSAWRAVGSGGYEVAYKAKKLGKQGNGVKNYKVAAFVSGFSTTDNQFKLAINKRYYDQDQSKIVIGFYCSSNPHILTLSLSYIIYPQAHPILDFTYSVQSGGQTGAYQISGPVNFEQNKKIQYNQWRVQNRFLVCTGSQCENQCMVRERCMELYGNVWEGQCVFCGPGVVFQYGRCAKKCGANQVYLNKICVCSKGFVRKGKDCVKQKVCGTNQVYDGKNCICKSGCADFYGQCKQCPLGAIPTPDSKFCQCTDSNKIYNPISHLCESRCLDNQIWSQNKCTCLPRHCWWGQQCRQCPDNSDPSSDQNTCLCRSQNSFYNAESNTCIECPATMKPVPIQSSYQNSNSNFGCTCRDGYILNGAVCVIKCKDNEIFNVKSGYCDCKVGLQRDKNGQCRPVAKCLAYEEWDGKSCRCVNGFVRFRNQCKQCPPGSLPNSFKTNCICTNSNQIFIPEKFGCFSCPQNSSPNQNLTKCLCKQGFSASGSSCILKCNKNQIPNLELGKCDCQYGYFKPTPSSLCIPRCKASQQWLGTKCICKPNHAPYNSLCTPCPKDSYGSPTRSSCLCTLPNHIFNPETFKCLPCPQNSYSLQNDTACICNKGFQSKGSSCVPVCAFDEELDEKTGRCQCKWGFMRVGPACVERCGINEEWIGGICVCKIGFAKIGGVCRKCPDGSRSNPNRTSCVCDNRKEYFSSAKLVCQACPAYGYPNTDYSDFLCQLGYKRDGQSCLNTCPSGAYPNQKGECICPSGLIMQNSQCKKPIQCPQNSSWNQNTLECICDRQGFYLINGACQSCGQNSVFNRGTKACVCQTGFFKIGGACTLCDVRSQYNGVDCVCNLGHFGNRDKCEKCHPTCNTCTGPQANQCTSCSDVSLILEKGFCSKNTPCSPGFFLSQSDKICTKCSDNCIICEDIFFCQACSIGYNTELAQIDGQQVQTCVEICGDGIRYEAQCDDGNQEDGDGCSKDCRVETDKGWTCQGGSSSRKSKCQKYVPDQTIIQHKSAVNLGDRVVQSVRASYLPKCLTGNQCSKCFRALKVNVVDANVPILVKINFIPFSQYQYLIEYNFQGLIVTSRFKTVIKLNEQFKGCLADDDFNQQLYIEIDPAFLAKVDVPVELSIDQIDPSKNDNKIQLPPLANKILEVGSNFK